MFGLISFILIQKGHPFNQIMHKYHEEKRRLVDKSAPQEIIDSSVPQVLLMT